MNTGRAILLSSALIATAIGGATWAAIHYNTASNRYELANTGGGSSVRLDRQTGDMIRCDRGFCSQIIKGGKVIAQKDPWAEFQEVPKGGIPPLPPGATLDEIPPPPPGFKLDP